MGHDASCCSCMLGWRNPDLASVIATAHLAVLPQGQCRQRPMRQARRRVMTVGNRCGVGGLCRGSAGGCRVAPWRCVLSGLLLSLCESNRQMPNAIHVRCNIGCHIRRGGIWCDSGQRPMQLLRLRPERRACPSMQCPASGSMVVGGGAAAWSHCTTAQPHNRSRSCRVLASKCVCNSPGATRRCVLGQQA